MNKLLLSVAFLTSFAVPSVAGTVTVTDFTANAAGVTSFPTDDLAVASFVSVTSWTVAEVNDPLGGLDPGDAIAITNPISTAIGSTLTISWDAGAFSDTIKTSGVTFAGDTLDLVGSGRLTGPGVPTNTNGVLDLAFTQAGGTGELISGSGSFTASSTVPEASTWAMILIGGGFLAMYAVRSRRRAMPNIA
jgi:hypothetical protein